MPGSVCVLASFTAKPGKEAEAEKILKSFLAPTHEEAGCVTYALHRRKDKPGTYYFVEKWRSQADLDSHLGSNHIKPALEKFPELFDVADIGIFEPISAGDHKKGNLFQG
jgi:quinol monooxygenase YgiN